MATYFISDLHLAANAPQISERFFQFIQHEINDANTLYILGDLFEYWVGDDAAKTVGMQPVISALQELTTKGVKGFFIAGNRDFLVGDQFSAETGFTVLKDETVVDLYGQETLLLHGDSLCIDDAAHQQFRSQMMTNPEWHQMALSKSIAERIEIAKQMRGLSAEHKMNLSDAIMDVNDSAVVSLMEDRNITHMIHGHTHRPNIHQHKTHNGLSERIVLGDWYHQQSYLRVDEQGSSLTH